MLRKRDGANCNPSRGEVWLADLNPIRGHEQAGRRPVLVISEDIFNHGPAELVVILPITSTSREVFFHVPVNPPEGGLKVVSFILSDSVRSISKERCAERLGIVSDKTLREVEDRLRILLAL